MVMGSRVVFVHGIMFPSNIEAAWSTDAFQRIPVRWGRLDWEALTLRAVAWAACPDDNS